VQRGDFVTVALQGDFGKPRPALVIQADSFADHATVTGVAFIKHDH
jgi:mRNA interferase MazF